MPKRIAVIGGGLSGLTAAFYVLKRAPETAVTLFESGSRLGGVIATESVPSTDPAHPESGRFVIDHGADMFATEPPAALELCRDLGVEDQLILPDVKRAGAMILHNGALVPIPDGFVLMRATKLWPMLATPLLSVGGKLRFLCERWIGPLPERTGHAGGDVSVADFVRHRMGSETLDRLVGALVAGIYTADIERLSMNATMAPLAAMVDQHGSFAAATKQRRRQNKDNTERHSAGARYEKFRSFAGGMQQLIDALVAGIDAAAIEMETAVTGLEFNPEDSDQPDSAWWRVDAGGQSHEFDQVVLATPAAVSSRLLVSVREQSVLAECQTASEQLAAIPSASTAIVVLCVHQSQLTRLPQRFGFVVPPIENRNILAVSFASHKYPVRCPADHCIIRVFVGGATQAALLDQSDEALIEMVRGELADLIGMQGRETLSRVVRWQDAMPQYHVGHLQRVSQIQDAIARVPGLYLTTNALQGVGIAAVVGAAKRVAQQLG
ncbi:protoporphyrinogen oxidase [Stieleria sp. TO1_6]|uniref:protoporphyrinogen oxidase n=1 Tax=Stieleria tagensis TaxID=2956795 RepID=UPI00209B0561|nr:protoporphyrinogen oxidase [Stieleria tagensis]MCO8122405.1 protoporphyrinogen oxidase [Stieleria tagensis]